MCEFCVKHGEGKKWYLNVKNYDQDLLSDLSRRNFVTHSPYWVENLYHRFGLLKLLPLRTPFIGNFLKKIIQNYAAKVHLGQVIPLEDVERILDFTNSITRVPCVCRIITTGKEHRLCFLISLDPGKIGVADIVDQSFLGGPDVAKFETVEKEWALNFIKESEMKRMIHTIWTFKTPFIGVLCNCDYATGCVAMKMFKEITPIMLRAEYVAAVDDEACVGCGECANLCQFDAIEIAGGKMRIDMRKCYGCGICRSVCNKKAIFLKDRQYVPETARL